MSIYQCEKCGCAENTALGWYWYTDHDDPEYKGKSLCSACGPSKFKDGTENKKCGEWHGIFKRTYYPLGSMETGPDGNLRQKDAGK